MRIPPTLVASLILCFSGLPAPNQATSATHREFSVSIVQETPLEALLTLAKEAHIPIGIICSDSQLLSQKVSLDYRGTDVNLAIRNVLSHASGYRVRGAGDGALVVSTAVSPELTTFGRSFGTFKTPIPMDATAVSETLWGNFQISINPARTGYGGELLVPPLDKELPAVTIKNASVITALNWIVTENGRMGWIIWPLPKVVVDAPQYRLWNLVFFPDDDSSPGKLCCVYPPPDLPDVDPTLREHMNR